MKRFLLTAPQRFWVARTWLAVASVCGVVGCDSPVQSSDGATVEGFVYVANGGSNDVSAYTLDPTSGALTAVAGSPFGSGTGPGSVVIAPGGKFVYVANRGSSDVWAYTIDASTGALTAVAGNPFAAGVGGFFSLAPSGKFAYVARYTCSSTSGAVVYSVSATTGALTGVGHPVLSGFRVRFSLSFAPGGQFAYVTLNRFDLNCHGTGSSVSVYSVDPTTGAFTAVGSVATGKGSSGVQITPNGRFGYVTNNGSLSAYTINLTTGALTAVARSPLPAGTVPGPIAFDPSSKFAYSTSIGSNGILAYTINAFTGALTAVAGSPFPTDAAPLSIAIAPSGGFVYVANAGSNDVSAYSIDATTGALKPVTGSPFAAGAYPISIAVFSR